MNRLALTNVLSLVLVASACGQPMPPVPSELSTHDRDRLVRAYRFVAEHGALMAALPCVCGCEQIGHASAEHCFVRRRGRIVSPVVWEPHGAHCGVCVDIAEFAMRAPASMTATDIRVAILKHYQVEPSAEQGRQQ